jgi:hypothetical protein
MPPASAEVFLFLNIPLTIKIIMEQINFLIPYPALIPHAMTAADQRQNHTNVQHFIDLEFAAVWPVHD